MSPDAPVHSEAVQCSKLMALLDVTRSHLSRSVDLYEELASEIPEAALGMSLPKLPSNTIGMQFWCVVGARETYSRAIEAGEWSEFACSLSNEDCMDQSRVASALHTSGVALLSTVAAKEEFTDEQNQLILDLLEHEAAHQGQLLRYLFALKLPIPLGWRSRYSLD